LSLGKIIIRSVREFIVRMLLRDKTVIKKSIEVKEDNMKLRVVRFSSEEDSTSGLLFDVTDGVKFLCYTLEDEYRSMEEKVITETRILEGTYRITLRKVGGIHNKYKKRFSDIHKGTLWVRDVPNFEYILIHCGNTDEHTSGCLLVGDTQVNNQIEKDGYIGKSTQAYTRIYPPIAKALEDGKEVTIEYINLK
tara:strand:- start:941 stop:1519 length:579 start_codon:yes stop_codon:yes gene_type:complete